MLYSHSCATVELWSKQVTGNENANMGEGDQSTGSEEFSWTPKMVDNLPDYPTSTDWEHQPWSSGHAVLEYRPDSHLLLRTMCTKDDTVASIVCCADA